jgi:guanylate kinase
LPHLAAGRDVIMDLDTQGAALLRAFPDEEIQANLVDVFILPPNREEFRQRLRDRSTETAEQIALRLKNADEEMTHWQEYTYSILSGTREQDVASISAIIQAERQRSRRLSPGAE